MTQNPTKVKKPKKQNRTKCNQRSEKASEAKLKCSKAPPKKESTPRSETSEAKKQAQQSLNDPKHHQRRETQRLASWILREEIRRNGALRRGDCLSEASLSPFSGMQADFSKIRAALTFCFFCVKAKEKKKRLIKIIIIFSKEILYFNQQ